MISIRNDLSASTTRHDPFSNVSDSTDLAPRFHELTKEEDAWIEHYVREINECCDDVFPED